MKCALFSQNLLPLICSNLYIFYHTQENFDFEDYTFDGDEESPLSFELRLDSGLTYLAGIGSVETPEGDIVTFPPDVADPSN